MAAVAAAEKAVRCLGRGFDMAGDLRLKYCKGGGAGCLVERRGETTPLTVPGVGVIADVPADVRCDKGDRVRFKSDVLEFNKVSTLPWIEIIYFQSYHTFVTSLGSWFIKPTYH